MANRLPVFEQVNHLGAEPITQTSGLLSLAIPLWVVEVSTGERWGSARHRVIHWPVYVWSRIIAGGG